MVSRGGGTQPGWRRDSRELFYVAPDGRLMTVDVATAPVFRAGIPQALFQTNMTAVRRVAVNGRYWDVSPDGNRFLVVVQPQESSSAPITVVLNWTARLKQ